MEKIVAGAGNQKLLFQFVTGEAQGRLRYQPCSECLIFFPPQLLLHGAGRREALGISLGLASRYSTKPRVTSRMPLTQTSPILNSLKSFLSEYDILLTL